MTPRGSRSTAPELLSDLLAQLDAALPFVVLRNHENLPHHWGNDVDILLRPADLPRASEIATAVLGRDETARRMRRLNFWSAQIACPDRVLQVDFYTALSKAWCTYAEAETILAARRRGPLFSTPDPLHEVLLIAAKELLAYGAIRPRYHERLRGHDPQASLTAAAALFGTRLSRGGCRLIARAVADPTVRGRPAVRAATLLDLPSMLSWASLRSAGWEPLALEAEAPVPSSSRAANPRLDPQRRSG